MELNEERFWRALRQTVKRAEAEEAADFADAESLLAATAPDAASQLSDERIAEVVRLVTSVDDARADAPAQRTPFADADQSADDLNEERFWHALRQTLNRAEAEEAAELADAERLLAETAPDAGSQFSDERIAEVVRLVTSADASAIGGAEDGGIEGTGLEESGFEADAWYVDANARQDAPVRPMLARREPLPVEPAPAQVVPIGPARVTWKQRLAKLPRPLAAAAALLLAPQFLAALGVITLVGVASKWLSYTTHTLSRNDAMLTLANTDKDSATRLSSLSVVVSHLVLSIEAVREVAQENSAVGTAALGVLNDLRQTLSGNGSASVSTSREATTTLADRLVNKSEDEALRIDALEQLHTQITQDLRMIIELQATPAPAELLATNAMHIRNVQELLAQ